MIQQPDLSILMTVHNGIENYPTGMLELALGDHLDISAELIITDDASTDDTVRAISELLALPDTFDPERVILHRHGYRQGAAAGYQSAAKLATGRYCILQSVRSWYAEGSLREMIRVLDEQPEIGFVYGMTAYHGKNPRVYMPPPFVRSRFWNRFDSLFGYMYRREALDHGCSYIHYLENQATGERLDVADYDFVMQLIVNMGYKGLALRELDALHYYNGGKSQMTRRVHENQGAIDIAFKQRWGDATA